MQPDLFVVPLEQARTMDWSRMKDLLLVVEVLSPATARADRFTKHLEYQRQQISLYWIVDFDQHRVEVWTPDAAAPGFELERLTWHPAGAAAGSSSLSRNSSNRSEPASSLGNG